MEQFIYTNKLGNSITIDYTGDYIIDNYSGLSASEIVPIVRSGYKQNGISLYGVNLGK